MKSIIFAIVMAIMLSGCGGNKQIVKSQEQSGSKTQERATAQEQESEGVVTDYYKVTGTSADAFMKSSAELYVNFRTAKIQINSATKNLKKYAISHAASAAAGENLKDAPTEESIKSLKAMKGKLSADELKYFATTAVQLVQTAGTLNESVKKAQELMPQASTATSKLPSELTGFNAMKIPDVTAGINQSIKQLSDVVSDAPGVAKEMLVLADAFKSLTE